MEGRPLFPINYYVLAVFTITPCSHILKNNIRIYPFELLHFVDNDDHDNHGECECDDDDDDDK